MKKVSISLLGIISIFAASCQEVVNVDLEQGQTRLVVEGRVAFYKERSTHIQEIKLSTTGNYFSNSETPRVSGAVVTINDNNGGLFNLVELQPGVYTTAGLIPQVGNTYELTIVDDGDTYRASETMLAVPSIDSLYQVFIEENLFNEAGVRLKIDYQDPAGEANFYYWEQYREGIRRINPNPGTKWTLVSSDEYYDGQYVKGRLVDDDILYNEGERGLIRQIAFSEFAYKYYFALFDQEGSRGNLSSPPAPIRGNIENLTNPDKYALGYFYASEISEKEIIIE